MLAFAAFASISLTVSLFRRRLKKNRVHYSDNEQNKNVIIVIGSTGAIGKRLTEKLLMEGWTVVAPLHRSPLPKSLSDRFDESQLISEFGFDVSKWKSVKQLVEKYHERLIVYGTWQLPCQSRRNPKILSKLPFGRKMCLRQ